MKVHLRRWEQAGDALNARTEYLIAAAMELSPEERGLLKARGVDGYQLRPCARWRDPGPEIAPTLDWLIEGREASFRFASFVDADAAEQYLREAMTEISGMLRAAGDRLADGDEPPSE